MLYGTNSYGNGKWASGLLEAARAQSQISSEFSATGPLATSVDLSAPEKRRNIDAACHLCHRHLAYFILIY